MGIIMKQKKAGRPKMKYRTPLRDYWAAQQAKRRALIPVEEKRLQDIPGYQNIQRIVGIENL